MKILIIKTGAMGDVVRCTFLAQALKCKYKENNPQIYWLTAKNVRLLFVNNPYVDSLFIENDESFKKLSKIQFDLVVNLEEGENLAKFASNLKPKKLKGFYFKDGKVIPSASAKEWFNMSALGPKPQNNILKKKNQKTHRQIMSEIVELKDYQKFEPFLRLNQKQRRIADNFLRRHNLSRSELIIGINTGAADRWPKSLSLIKTVKLIDKLYKKFNAKILLFGGPGEIERNKQILSLSKSPIIDTGCGNNLLEFPALISLCHLFITTDSLGLHIALALKRKTICLIGPTSPSELEMYKIGERVVSDSKCTCCYSSNCKSMEKINLDEVIKKITFLLQQKITLLITAFKEPRIGKAIEHAINQKTSKDYDILISAPDKETLDIVQEYQKKNKKIKIFKDPGKGKSYALNLVFQKLKTDLLILTDGDVFISENTVESISNSFLDPEVGCVTGRPVPIENKNNMFGYWANFLFDSAHKLRENASKNHQFIECSGYLFAFRKEFVNKIPSDVAEDTIIPYYFWEKGYRVEYVPEVKVYVKNVDNLEDWIKQKIRTSKAHETLGKYVDTKITPRVKTFKSEALNGIRWVFSYPKNIKQTSWSCLLVLARLYMWSRVFYDTKLKNKHYRDAWERAESTK